MCLWFESAFEYQVTFHSPANGILLLWLLLLVHIIVTKHPSWHPAEISLVSLSGGLLVQELFLLLDYLFSILHGCLRH